MFARLWSFSALSCLHFFLFLAFFHLFCTGTTCVLFSVLQRGDRDDLQIQIQIQICLSVCRPGWLRCDCRWLRSRYQLFSVLSAEFSRFTWGKKISFHFHIKDTKRGAEQEFRKEAKKNETIATTNVTEKPQAKAREKPERGRESIGVTGRVREEGRESAANNKGTNKLQQPIGMIINCSVQFASVCDFDFVRYK